MTPILDRTIPHPDLSNGLDARFGYAFTTGDVEGTPTGPLDDLVIAAIDESLMIGGNRYSKLGACYAFIN